MGLMEHQSMNIATRPLSPPSALAFVKMPLFPLGLQSSHVGHYGAHFIYYCQVSTGQNLSASLVFCYIFGCNQKIGNSRITQVNLPKKSTAGIFSLCLLLYIKISLKKLSIFLGPPWEVSLKLTLFFDLPNLLMFSTMYAPCLSSNRWLFFFLTYLLEYNCFTMVC